MVVVETFNSNVPGFGVFLNVNSKWYYFIMVYVCSIKSCRNTGKGGIHMHKFPINKSMAMMWINQIHTIQPSYVPTKTSMICSAHFKSSDYNSNKKKTRLNSNAIPSIFITTNKKSLVKVFDDLPHENNIHMPPTFVQYDNTHEQIINETSIANESFPSTTMFNPELSTDLNNQPTSKPSIGNESFSSTTMFDRGLSTDLNNHNRSTNESSIANESFSNTTMFDRGLATNLNDHPTNETSIGNENFPNTNLFDPGLSTSLNNHATSDNSIANENFPSTTLFDPGLSSALNNHATSESTIANERFSSTTVFDSELSIDLNNHSTSVLEGNVDAHNILIL